MKKEEEENEHDQEQAAARRTNLRDSHRGTPFSFPPAEEEPPSPYTTIQPDTQQKQVGRK